MPLVRFFVSIDAFSTYALDAPTLEVLVDGIVVASLSVTSTSAAAPSTDEFLVEFAENDLFPNSLQFRFTDGSTETGRSVTLETVRINGQAVDDGDLSQIVLTQNQASSLDIASNDSLFGRVDPTITDFGTVTQNGTVGDDRIIASGEDDVVDGGDGADRLRGLNNDDAISGGDGDDTLFGGGGNDALLGGGGNDLIFGNGDDDFLFGQQGDDVLIGGGGNDLLNGGDGVDFLLGDAGDDILFGEAGDDTLVGSIGNDSLFGDAGSDTLSGGDGDDFLSGGNGNDNLIAEAGNDIVQGGDGDDFIDTGAGNDLVDGGDGVDFVSAGDGDDTVDGGSQADQLYGGAGVDTLNGDDSADVLSGGLGADTLNGGQGNDTLHGNGIDSMQISQVLRDNPNLVFSEATHSFYEYVTAATDVVTARDNAANSSLTGVTGVTGHLANVTSQVEADFLFSLTGGAETWIGGTDVDREGVFIFNGGAEAGSQFYQGDGATGGTVGSFFNVFRAGDPNNGGGNQDSIILTDQPDAFDRADTEVHGYIIEYDVGAFLDDDAVDTLNGNLGNDTLYGYGGDDILNGNVGRDILFGGTGNDTLDGGTEDDVLIGGEGADTLLGGNGNDIFQISGTEALGDSFDGGTGADEITLLSDVTFNNATSFTNIDTIASNEYTIFAEVNEGFDLSTILVTGTSDLRGQDGNETIVGSDSDDTIDGSLGDDTLTGGAGNDTILGDTAAQTAVLEAGSITVTQTSTTQFHTVNFSTTIENAVVKVFANDVPAGEPFTVRVRNITDTGFEFQLDEFDFQDGVTGPQNLSFVAVASGTHTLSNGLQVEAGFTSLTNEAATTVSFNGGFANPVVFSQVSSDNDLSAVVTRNDNVSGAGFSVQLQEEEAADGVHATESVGFIAIETGGSVVSGILAANTGNIVDEVPETINFGGTFASTPIFIADQQTLNGGDTAFVEGQSLSTMQAQVIIEEETSADAEVGHTNEEVGFLAIEEGIFSAVTLVNGSDQLFGGNGDDSLYADGVAGTTMGAGTLGNRLAAEILQDTPVAYFDLNDTSGTTIDNQGSLDASVDGTTVGGPVLGGTALYIGGGASIDFDGVDDGIRIPDSPSINETNQAQRTVELVFNADDITTRQVLYEEGATVNGLTIYVDGGNVFITAEDDGNFADVNISAAINVGQTYHVAFVFDQPTNSFTGYLDGVNIGSVGVGNQVFPAHGGDIGIGYAPDGVQFHDGEAGGGFFFDGRISDVAIYNTALSAAEIAARSNIVQGVAEPEAAIDDTLAGGDGFDQLFGGEGRDVFVFEAANAFNDVDQITGFSVLEQDALDISDILIGFDPLADAISDFVEVTESAGNTLIGVDADGAANGVSFSNIAQINNLTGVDLDVLSISNSLIV